MKTRNIAKQFDTMHDFGIRDLIVAGCSFSYNNHEHSACAWPYYLRDLGGFDTVYDFSMVGGGNRHICNAMIYELEQQNLDLDQALIVVQWAGHDRDDYIVDPSAIDLGYPFQYHYDAKAWVGITGGQEIANFVDPNPISSVKKIKNHTCRAIENFITIRSLDTYLRWRGCRYVFFEYRDYSLPGRDANFDPRPLLPDSIHRIYDDMMTTMPENFYRFCLYHDLMMPDDFHPSPDGHLAYTRQILLPKLVDMFGNKQ